MAKKSFLDTNPAMAYITPQVEEEQTIQEIEPRKKTAVPSRSVSSKVKETKNRRVSMMMTPSLHVRLEILAHMQRISLNELVSRVMGEYAASKNEQIDKYQTLLGDK